MSASLPRAHTVLDVQGIQAEFLAELRAIGDWWLENTLDEKHGGFVGEITPDNVVNASADKGVILNTRILWFFSEAALFTGCARYASAADRAYRYIVNHFLDRDHGGVFWMVDCEGQVTNTRKQVYAQAFAIYAFSAYYKLTKNEGALKKALSIFELLEAHAKDEKQSGYLEAFSHQWGDLDDVRLSVKDLNSPKSMNTHLHVLEAYTALHIAAPNKDVAAAIAYGLDLFDCRIIDKKGWHLRMFQAMDWSDLSSSYSYGHDIECSWLMWEAVEAIHTDELIARYKEPVIQLAKTCLEQGIGKNHEVLDAFNFETQTLVDERVWWVQAEALVGFLNAFKLTGEQAYFDAAIKVWAFIKEHQLDDEGGEWHWLSKLDAPHVGDCKIGAWKAPYHNGRAMMEAIKILRQLA